MILEENKLQILQEGKIEVLGEFLWGSNYTFLVQVTYEDQPYQAVYKPMRGERPLWDFPPASLGKREVAAYLVSEALGWGLVPPTVYRKKAPAGGGSLQWFIEHDPNYHFFNFSPEDVQRLRPVVLFDLLINNADRKGSHVIKDADDHLWLIDHGVCFHVEDKLRTVIWDFVGESIPAALCEDLQLFCYRLEQSEQNGGLAVQLSPFLSLAERRALLRRARGLVVSGYYPNPAPNRRPFPWPEI
jgi:uncharacterized repeat protein (TIGR03843 family)